MKRLTLVLATLLALTGCGLRGASEFTPDAEPGSIRPLDGTAGVQLVVGSKNFTEQIVLGKIAVIALQVSGFDVVDSTNIPGSVAHREGILSGEVDLHWEYTGTAWISYLGNEAGIPDRKRQWEAVRKADAKNGLTWLPPAPMNNTYGFAVRREAVAELGGITKLSQIADLPVDQRTFCVESEFASRNDGFEPMLAKYDLAFGKPRGVPRDNVRMLDTGAIYAATDAGACSFGEIFTTDGRLKALGLTVLEDDRHFFPAYNVAPVVRTDVLAQHPQLAQVLGGITPMLTDDVLIELNRRVDVDGEEPADVALEWMRSKGLVG
ncbi:MAG TPA: glycine betaine ABC transporter substrate-binding protein [Mycobacteriales bacterium]|jgi:osmoprotectant transport system substrate-binding protein|nr:putative glycine/betaine transporter, substrate-binding protein [Cryptosporangiaceae bacterium]MDQ1676653.1 osmoprotectant transport system substrate-binding protein [Actinomycetota bacterium]HEV7756957.1 glycine betaine ABC transporter substrate-binding protein [Mycobacteriales bacterium]